MEVKSMTAIVLKKINKNKVYTSIYEDRATSKMQIVQKLGMGLTTERYGSHGCLETGANTPRQQALPFILWMNS